MIRKPLYFRIGVAALFAAAMATTAAPSFAYGTGAGSCSVWQSIKSAMTGVYCKYL